MMKKIFSFVAIAWIFATAAMAATTLPDKCTVGRPNVLNKKIVKDSEINAFLKSGSWGQNSKTSNYWKVYSDRSHNTTYNSSSESSGKAGELEFNEELRIAKIENGFALVYKERNTGVSYPIISTDAESKGWVPMKNLLLWQYCPTDEAGIYNKALIVINIDQAKGNTDVGRRYMNPVTKEAPKKLVADMNFYFVMKKADNGLVLLARECKMEGYTYQVLYGWVSTASFVPWSQRTCIEPNWDPLVAEQLKDKPVDVMKDGRKATDIRLGRTNRATQNEATKYRLEPQLMRYPLLGNSGNDKQYKVTAFARPDGTSHVPTVPSGYDNSSAGIVDEGMKAMSTINLIVVIDGTKSMNDFYEPTQKMIQQAYNYFDGQNREVKVGIVIYRDYADGKYVTEFLKMRKPTDPSVAKFLQSGGEYGVKSSPADRTNAEALFKGIEVALDTKLMGYSSKNSNLMFVVGDCGNDLNDTKCLKQEEIIRRCVQNRVQVSAFQVRNENDQAFNLFRKQMGAIVRENLKAQYAPAIKEGHKAGFKELADGYDFKTDLPAKSNFYIGSTRNADMGKQMDLQKLAELMKNSYMQFNDAIEAQIAAVASGSVALAETTEAGRSTLSSMDIEILNKIFTPEQIAEIKKNNSLMAFQGYTDKKASNDMDYWQPIIYISSDELAQMMEKLRPVSNAATTTNRRPFVNAVKALLRSMIPDITESEIDNMDVKEIMAMIAGLNVKSGTLGGRTLIQIQDENIVDKDEFDGMIADFIRKYRKLEKIMTQKYEFSVERNKTIWYWIPVEDLP